MMPPGGAVGRGADTPALELRGVSRRFGGVLANDDVSFAVARGSIHAVVGENGAGKSTAMRIAYGMETPDAGEILIDGVVQRFAGPRQAIRRGLAMVHQHFMLIDAMTVTENVVLGVEPGRPWAVDFAGAAARLAALSRDFGLAIDPAAQVADLAVGERQRVELLKALYRQARLLILDEPTAVLAPPEVAALFAVLRRMRQEGRTVVLISHKLSEVLALADAVTVLRDGRCVATLPLGARGAAGGAAGAAGGVGAAELARLMVGGEEAAGRPASGGEGRAAKRQRGRPGGAAGGPAGGPEGGPDAEIPVLEVSGLKVAAGDGTTGARLDGVSFVVGAGEIVGIAGVEGNGQSELIEALAGLADPAAVRGVVRLAGVDLAGADARRRRRLGMAHIPEDRQRRGLILDFDLAENSVLGAHDRPPAAVGPLHAWLDRGAMNRGAATLLARFAVRPAVPSLPARALSGGNQQKLMAGRELSLSPRLLLAAQPTRGVDLGGSAGIHRELLARRDAGCAVLLVSSELDELLALADRLLVFHRGRIVGELDPVRASAEEIGLLMTGGAAASDPAPRERE